MRSLKIDHEVLVDLTSQATEQLDKRELSWAFHTLDFLWASMDVHVRVVRSSLFPAILSARRDRFGLAEIPSYDEACKVIARLQADHDFFMSELEECVAALRPFRKNADKNESLLEGMRERILKFAARLLQHRDEEEVVHQWPRRLLQPAELTNLQKVVRHQSQEVPLRFATT